ncbi:MAG: hypothetical protein U0521_21370 [Anaerolineae bacterium]
MPRFSPRMPAAASVNSPATACDSRSAGKMPPGSPMPLMIVDDHFFALMSNSPVAAASLGSLAMIAVSFSRT